MGGCDKGRRRQSEREWMKESTVINVNDLLLSDGGFHCISLYKSLVGIVKNFQLMKLPSVLYSYSM